MDRAGVPPGPDVGRRRRRRGPAGPIGLLVAPFRRTLPRWAAALIGLVIAATIAIAGNLLLGPGMIEPNRPEPGRYFPYVFWILGPSLLVLIGLPWVGWMLRADWPRKTGHREAS